VSEYADAVSGRGEKLEVRNSNEVPNSNFEILNGHRYLSLDFRASVFTRNSNFELRIYHALRVSLVLSKQKAPRSGGPGLGACSACRRTEEQLQISSGPATWRAKVKPKTKGEINCVAHSLNFGMPLHTTQEQASLFAKAGGDL
jgi:hypothetical protein